MGTTVCFSFYPFLTWLGAVNDNDDDAFLKIFKDNTWYKTPSFNFLSYYWLKIIKITSNCYNSCWFTLSVMVSFSVHRNVFSVLLFALAFCPF